MLQKSNFLIETAVANRSEAMEADTGSKNGRSSKSRTSRESIFKLAGILLVACVLFTGCKKDEDDNDDNHAASTDKITAKINDASKFGDVKKVEIRGYYYESGSYIHDPIAEGDFKDGGFTIILPETVNEKYLTTLENLSNKVNVSNNKVKRMANNQVPGVNSANEDIVIFTYKKEESNSEPYKYVLSQMVWYYVDGDLNVSGTTPSIYHEGINTEMSDTYSLKLKKGWNITYHIQTTTKQGDKMIQKNEYTNSAVSGLKWAGLSLN